MSKQTMKRCACCKEEFPATLDFFHRDRSKKDGLNCYCRECNKTKAQKWLEHHSQRARETKARYRKANREALREQEYQRYWNDPEKAREVQKERSARYRQTERGKATKRMSEHRRRARKASQGTEDYTKEDLDQMYQAQNKRCWWCGKKLGRNYHIDHRIPISRGGSDTLDNICLVHAHCNWSKGAKMPWEWTGRLL